MKTYFIETWGCQMNHHDSERLAGVLQHQHLREASSQTKADIVLLNTCSVREKPVRKILNKIEELARLDPRPIIGVCGCVAQQKGEALLETSAAVDFVLGPGQIGRMGEALQSIQQGKRGVFVGFEDIGEVDRIFRKSTIRGMVTVIEGCDEYCTFCIVPYTRGHELSRPVDKIITEIESLAAAGIREIELLGQTINSYSCPETGKRLSDLLASAARIPGIERIRFITSHPRHFGEDLIQVLTENPKVSRYLHLPFQAGSDRILKRMNRKYTRRYYCELVERIRSSVPDINLSTDVIVGFPGETEEDFLETLDVLKELRFGQVFAFAFSPRPGTPAAKYSDPVDEKTQKDRLHRLFAMTDEISRQLNEELIGRTVPVLIDGFSRRSSADWKGRGEDNRIINFPSTGREQPGDIVEVEILRATAHSLVGHRPGSLDHLPLL